MELDKCHDFCGFLSGEWVFLPDQINSQFVSQWFCDVWSFMSGRAAERVAPYLCFPLDPVELRTSQFGPRVWTTAHLKSKVIFVLNIYIQYA